jgi:integrase
MGLQYGFKMTDRMFSNVSKSYFAAHLKQIAETVGIKPIRVHDLRHTAATNMHQLTGNFFTVGMILGHSLKGTGIQLGISTKLDAVTAQYVDVRLERKKEVLDAYHNVLHPKPQIKVKSESKSPKKKSRDVEL